MADWATIASLSTAAGTLVLAVATFSSVRSSQRAARVAEQSLLVGMRPVLAPSHLNDPPEKVMFGDRKMVHVKGGMAAVEADGDSVYLVIPLRNVGAGLAVLHGWSVEPTPPMYTPGAPSPAGRERPDPQSFRRLSRDLYVPAGDVGFWQGAVRDRDDPLRAVVDAAAGGSPIVVDLLYGDAEGGQRAISRFSLYPREDGEGWTSGVVRHWRLDGIDPRG